MAGPRIAVITFNDIPAVNRTAKYERLGRMALVNRRRYCLRHGYTLIDAVPVAQDRPACWAKIPAILEAFGSHEWVLWADSDALACPDAAGVEPLLDAEHDLITQANDRFYAFLGVSVAAGNSRMPINTGVFLMRATEWSRDFLRSAYSRTEFISRGAIWNGIGEQEAMIAELLARTEDLARIKYVEDLQAPPRFYRPATRFIHFYGNHTRPHVPPTECAAVLDRWEIAVSSGDCFPGDMARFHWCCIQNKDPADPALGGDLRRYFYTPRDLRSD